MQIPPRLSRFTSSYAFVKEGKFWVKSPLRKASKAQSSNIGRDLGGFVYKSEKHYFTLSSETSSHFPSGKSPSKKFQILTLSRSITS